ncbi:MAG: AraC family transcriptional regulator [Clostridiales bacterium]|nr:AraC family transcriptional regulator [Clostridiales bacterium]
MPLDYLDRNEYRDIPLLKMIDNRHGDLPFFIRKYTLTPQGTSMHRHEYMQINYVYRGRAKHIINNRELDIIKGDIFVIPPYIPHMINQWQHSEAVIFEFEFNIDFVNESFDSMENMKSFLDFAYIEPFLVTGAQVKPRLNISGKVQVEVENLLNEALREFNEKRDSFVLLIKSLLLKLLIIVGREFNIALEKSDDQPIYARHRDAIYNAMNYIETNYTEDITMDDIVKVSMLSQSYFSYLFKSITRKTFIEYLNGIRISKAMELLKTTDKRVLDICMEVGFNNVNHFNRLFKQNTGISPMQYRKKCIL